ncbi:MAG: hypothetical protein ABIG60_00310 [Patescibacteria group bacterium]
MKRKETQKFSARKLRKQGKSYSEILKKVKVSKSTLSLWLRDIGLSNKQREALQGRTKSRYLGSKSSQFLRIELTKEIIKNAKGEAKKLISDPLFLSGVMLYWAEGTKRGGELVCFSNSDPNTIEFMMKWFRKICLVPENKFRIQIHIHTLLRKRDIKKYWSKVTKISEKQFHKLIIKETSLRYRKNILYNGTCFIRVCDRNLFRKIMGWKIGVLEHFGIEDNYQIPK